MSDHGSPVRHKATRVAGALLGPSGTFPAALHTLSDEMPGEPSALETERRGHDVRGSERLDAQTTPERMGWAIGIAIAAWGIGSIVFAILVGALLGLTGVATIADDVAVTLGYVDLVLIVPAVWLAMRSERLAGRGAWVVVAIGASAGAILASLLGGSLPAVFIGALGLVAARATRRRWLRQARHAAA